MSVTSINFCGNILLKSENCIFLVIPKFWGLKKSSNLFTGFTIHFFLKIGTPEIVKNRFSKKNKVKLHFLKKNALFDQNCIFLDFLEILSQSLETLLSYHYYIKMGCFGTKNFCQIS